MRHPIILLMDSYEGFARRFDRMVDWKRRRRREAPFFHETLPEGTRTVLDCHCGTGFHCVMLTEMGYEVEGVDVSPHMLAVARKNLKERDLHLPLHLCDVKEMRLEREFDCVISMGNSLPHEFGDDNLLKSLQCMHDALRPGGHCIVHSENFDRLYRDGDRFIPSGFRRTGHGSETFIFVIDYFSDLVVFNILSMIEERGIPQFNVDIVKYNPVSVAKLRTLMTQAGFCAIEVFGDFNRTPIENSESYDAIFVARRGH
jgi:SAM-dependent methyltransferase